MLVTLPLAFCLIVKIYFGLRWLKMKRTLPVLISYYLISWTFYTSFVLTETLILIVGWYTFTISYIAIVISLMICALISWLVLYFHVRYADQLNRTMNENRRKALLEKQSRAQQKENDRLLIEAH